ncbi:MAG: hypothetical protein DWI57_00365 [Chloroflexi bacterium]|nr:MAG: hypothetical protein DWI57_00365 [Chloroflexota bacterium]
MSANPSVATNQANRLAVIRRLYLYGVVVVSLVVMLAAIDDLTGVLTDLLLGPKGLAVGETSYLRDSIARNAGTLLVAAPLFVVHWYFVRRMLSLTPERLSALRKLALYGVAIFALGMAASHLHQWLYQSTGLLLGESRSALNITSLAGNWLYRLLMLIVSGGLGWFLLLQLRADGDCGHESGRAATVRRLFQISAGLVGFAVALSGAAILLQVPLRLGLERLATSQLTVGDFAWAQMAANGVAALLVGLLVWRINWRAWEMLISSHPAEAATALRRFYLYAATLIAAAVAVTPAAMLLGDILRRLFGYPSGAFLTELSIPVSLIVAGLIAWRWHWGQVQAEAARYGDSPESANVRRLYYYLVAAIGLILLWIGLVDLLRLLLDWLFVGGTLDEYRAGQAANGLSLLAVGAPVWVLHWRTVQRAAEGEAVTAQAERRSGPRRAYLYGVALAGALLILFDLGSVLYRLILGLLGEWSGGAPIYDAIARSGTGAVFWALHLLAIRTDNRLAGDEAEPDVATDERRAALEERIAQLESALAAARAELAQL